MRRSDFLAVMAGMAGAAAMGCGESGDPAGPAGREVHLTSSSFEPANLTIAAGTRVRWVNDHAVFHTITPENSSQPGVWQRREMSVAGQTFDHTFTVSGQTYRYRCEPHSTSFTNGMVGTITVT